MECQHLEDCCVRFSGRCQKRCKFVSAETRSPEYAGLLVKAPADLRQNLVADRVTILIIQRLEAVEVNEDESQRPTCAFLGRNKFDERAPVLKARQWIFGGEPRLLAHEVSQALANLQVMDGRHDHVRKDRNDREDSDKLVIGRQFRIKQGDDGSGNKAHKAGNARGQRLYPARVIEKRDVDHNANQQGQTEQPMAGPFGDKEKSGEDPQ